VLAAGIGLSGTTYVPLDDCHEWDPTAASWIAGARLPTGIRTPALAGDPVVGGVLLLGSPGTTLPLFLRYDGLSWTPITTPTVPTTAFGFGLAFDTSRDRLVTFGGTSPLVTLDATWEWDRNDWVRVVGGPPGSAGYRMVYDAALRAPLLFTPNSLTSVSQWNGRSWTTIGNTAPGYIYPAYAFDRARGVTVRYGGLDFARLASVDRDVDVRPAPPGSSSRRRSATGRPLLGAAMAFDELRGTVLLFGGMVAGRGLSDDTWEWNGNNWTQLQPTVRPPARILHTLTFDRRARPHGAVRRQWSLDRHLGVGRQHWFATTPTRTPTAMQLAFMTYDDARQRCVALGLGTNFDEHWEWDGSDWLQRQPTLLPPPRNDAAIAFDETRQCVVMFGGQLSGTGRLYTDTWELRSQVEGSYRDLGAGCATPAATLTSVGAQKPWSGEALSVEVAAAHPDDAGGRARLFGVEHRVEWRAAAARPHRARRDCVPVARRPRRARADATRHSWRQPGGARPGAGGAPRPHGVPAGAAAGAWRQPGRPHSVVGARGHDRHALKVAPVTSAAARAARRTRRRRASRAGLVARADPQPCSRWRQLARIGRRPACSRVSCQCCGRGCSAQRASAVSLAAPSPSPDTVGAEACSSTCSSLSARLGRVEDRQRCAGVDQQVPRRRADRRRHDQVRREAQATRGVLGWQRRVAQPQLAAPVVDDDAPGPAAADRDRGCRRAAQPPSGGSASITCTVALGRRAVPKRSSGNSAWPSTPLDPVAPPSTSGRSSRLPARYCVMPSGSIDASSGRKRRAHQRGAGAEVDHEPAAAICAAGDLGEQPARDAQRTAPGCAVSAWRSGGCRW
jgi:hypothetical protein